MPERARYIAMQARDNLIATVIHSSIVLAAIAAVVVLGIHGTLDGQSVIAVLGAAIGFAGANATAVSSLGAAINGKATVPTETLTQREVTLRAAMGANPPAGETTSAADTASMRRDEAQPQ